MKKHRISYFLSMTFLFASLFGYSQNKYTLPQLNPQSPNAASFGKYGEIPVTLSTGTVNNSVPLLNIKIGSFELPINLTNNNNGLKVDEMPSFVGNGWNLNAGGVINCSQRGNYDFAVDGVGLFTSSTYNSMDSLKAYWRNIMIGERKYNYQEKVLRGDMDSQFDLYNYNFLGRSGSFYFDSNQNIITVPKSNLKISKPYEGLFIIVDEKGNKYWFGQTEYNEGTPYPDDAIATRRSFSNNASYFLTGILTTENREITFSYTSYPFSYQRVHKYVNQYAAIGTGAPNCPNNSWQTGYTNFNLENYLLTSISFDEGSIQFDLSDEYRQDLKEIYSGINVPYLKQITLINNENDTIRDFKLHYNNVNRLQLTDVIKDSSINNHEVWKFEYYGDTSLCPIFSISKDHWGYYNGTLASSGVPEADYSSFLQAWDNPIGVGANRESNFTASRDGVLKKITYPTGGTTSFEYQPNRIVFNDYQEILNYRFLNAPLPTIGYLVYATTDNVSDTIGSFTLTESAFVNLHAIKTDLYNGGIEDPAFVVGHVYLGTDPSRISSNLLPNGLIGWIHNMITGIAEHNNILFLDAGTYYWGVYKNTEEFPAPGGYSALFVSAPPPSIPYVVGGVRISSIESNDSVGHTITRKYFYKDNIDSLVFRNAPNYLVQTHMRVVDGFACSDCGVENKIHDESVYPLIGNPVEYVYVTEQTDDPASNGKIDYTFLSTENFSAGSVFPSVTPYLASWRSGSPSLKKIYKKEADNFILVQKDSFDYDSYNPPESLLNGYNFGYLYYCSQEGYWFRVIDASTENYLTERFYQKAATQTIFDDTGSITTGSSTVCNSPKHTLPTEIITINSIGDTIRQRIKYSSDYDTSSVSTNDALSIRNLQRQNVHVPIERISTRTMSGTEYVIGGTLFTFKVDTIAPAKVYQLKIVTPILYSSFSQSTISSGSFSKASQYDERAEFTKYDDFNNVLQEHYSNDIYKSYIWDYKKVYPVAQVVNAKASDIAYTSFETSSKGNWIIDYVSGPSIPITDTCSMTGKRSYTGGVIIKSGLTSGNYVISYWSRGGSMTINGSQSGQHGISTNGWTYYEHRLSGVDSIYAIASGIIDELRLYPEKAQMNTYTHDPLIGITSECDINNRIVYYEYDKVGRLILIRDIDKNILKKICYNYSGQTEDCD